MPAITIKKLEYLSRKSGYSVEQLLMFTSDELLDAWWYFITGIDNIEDED